MSRGSKILELRRQTWLKRATPTSTAFVQASERVRATAEPNRAGDRPVVPGRLLLKLLLKAESFEISFFLLDVEEERRLRDRIRIRGRSGRD